EGERKTCRAQTSSPEGLGWAPAPWAQPSINPAIASSRMPERRLMRLGLLCTVCSLRFQAHLFQGSSPGVGLDQPQPWLLHPRSYAARPHKEKDGHEHSTLVHELLDLVHQRLALTPVRLHVLLFEQLIDVGIAPIGEDASAHCHLLKPCSSVAISASAAQTQAAQLLGVIRRLKRGALHCAQLHLDPHRS